MSHSARTEQKRALFSELLQDGIVSLHFDPRAPGVQVPARFVGQAQLVLNFSYRYRLHDFAFSQDVVEATLSFGGQPFFCRVPWYAVFAVTNDGRDKGQVWAQDVPPEMGGPVRDWPEPPPPRTPVRKGKPALRVLREADAPEEPEAAAPSSWTDSSPAAEPAKSLPDKVDRPRPALRALSAVKPAAEPSASPAEPSTSGEAPPPEPPPPRAGGHLRRIK